MIIHEEIDESSISPPMEYDKWREKRLQRIDELNKLVASNKSMSCDENKGQVNMMNKDRYSSS